MEGRNIAIISSSMNAQSSLERALRHKKILEA